MKRALVGLAMLLAAPHARAQDRRSEAEQLFYEGRQALLEGRHDEACAKFDESLALVEVANTLFNVARCREREGRIAEALERWQRGLALLPEDDERRATVAAEIEALKARVPKEAEAPRPALPTPPTRKSVPIPKPAPREPEPDARLPAGIVVGSVGIAGFIAAAITGAVLLQRDDEIDELCPDQRCTPEGRQRIEGTGPLLVGNAIAWGIGIVGLGVGGSLLIWKALD